MNIDGKIKFLTETLNKQIGSFESGRKSNKKKAFRIKMLSVSFSAGTTILLGIKGFDNTNLINISIPLLLGNLALILSALVTLLSAFDAFFNHRSLWIRYTVTLNQLRSVKAELDYLTSSQNQEYEEEKIDDIFRKIQSVLDETNKDWLGMRSSKEIEKQIE